MKKWLLIFGLVFLGCESFAFNIVYPKKNDVVINAESTFFIGSSDKPLKINGADVPIHPSGGFAYVVKLLDGQNTFVIQSEDEKQIFVVTKPKIQKGYVKSDNFVPFSEKKYFYVTVENAPLRSSPVDSGINRIAHLQRNIELLSDGEKNGFYRIVLGNSLYGWISKANVKEYDNYEVTSAVLYGYEHVNSEDYNTFIFHLDKRIPFEIAEGQEELLIKFYNVKDQENNTFTMKVPVNDVTSSRKIIGYSGEYQGNDFVLKIRKPIITNSWRPLHNIKIAIDAGHGGSEVGAIGCLGDKEKDLNLVFAKLLETELKKRGAKVIMTRSSDTYVGLKERVDIANANNANVLLSLHGNALPDGRDPNKNRGTSIYYYYNQAKPLADVIMNKVVSELGVPNDKVRQGSLALVRNTNALSLLIEISYLINPEDNANLTNPEFQKQYVKAVADGIEEYFSK